MRTTEISTSELDLWNVAYSIRGLVEDQSFYFGANPLPDGDGRTLISSVEQIFLTEGMMLSFLREQEPEGMFAADLRKWGVIQALVVQQDAVDFLAQILQEPRLNPNSHADLRVIRDDLRNRYVGHPVRDHQATKFVVTAVSKDKEASFIELGAGGIEVRRFDLMSSIDTQRRILLDFLTDLKIKVMETEERFREGARAAQPLNAVRHSTFNYNLDKAHPETDGMHLHNAKELQKQLGLFRRAFEEVGRLNQWISSDLDSMDYAAAQVVAFHEADEDRRRLTPEDVGIFLSFLGHSYVRLIAYVDEIEGDINDPPN
jgi:hypothetical protein